VFRLGLLRDVPCVMEAIAAAVGRYAAKRRVLAFAALTCC